MQGHAACAGRGTEIAEKSGWSAAPVRTALPHPAGGRRELPGACFFIRQEGQLALKPTLNRIPHSQLMNEPSIPDLGFGSPSANDPFQAAKASAMKAAEELRAAASQKASELRGAAESRAQHLKSVAEQKASELKTDLTEKAGEIRHYADDALGQAKDKYQDLVAEAENMTREKPRQALLTAFGVGLVVGLLLRR